MILDSISRFKPVFFHLAVLVLVGFLTWGVTACGQSGGGDEPAASGDINPTETDNTTGTSGMDTGLTDLLTTYFGSFLNSTGLSDAIDLDSTSYADNTWYAAYINLAEFFYRETGVDPETVFQLTPDEENNNNTTPSGSIETTSGTYFWQTAPWEENVETGGDSQATIALVPPQFDPITSVLLEENLAYKKLLNTYRQLAETAKTEQSLWGTWVHVDAQISMTLGFNNVALLEFPDGKQTPMTYQINGSQLYLNPITASSDQQSFNLQYIFLNRDRIRITLVQSDTVDTIEDYDFIRAPQIASAPELCSGYMMIGLEQQSFLYLSYNGYLLEKKGSIECGGYISPGFMISETDLASNVGGWSPSFRTDGFKGFVSLPLNSKGEIAVKFKQNTLTLGSSDTQMMFLRIY